MVHSTEAKRANAGAWRGWAGDGDTSQDDTQERRR